MWTCPKCGEKIEDDLDFSYNCAVDSGDMNSSRKWLTVFFSPLALIMALLAPALADCIHSASIVSSGTRFYNAPLEYIASGVFWIFVLIRAVGTHLAIYYSGRMRFGSVLVWCCCAILWLLVDAQMDVAIK